MTDQNAPAAWYPDGSGNDRWWDGYQWTEHVRPTEAPAPAPEPQPVFAAAPQQQPAAQQPAAQAAWAQPSAVSTAAPKDPTLVADHITLAAVAIASAVLVLVGSVGPWATAGGQSANGTADGADGILTLIIAIVGAALVGATAYLPVGVPRIVTQWAAVVAGLAIVVIGIIDVQDVNSSGIVDVGWGLWLVVIAGAVLTIAGVLLAVVRGHKR